MKFCRFTDFMKFCCFKSFLLFFRMDKKKKTPHNLLLTKNKSEKQAPASTKNVSNPILSEIQPDYPSLQSSVAPAGEAAPQETLEKKIIDLIISESEVQKHEQLKPRIKP